MAIRRKTTHWAFALIASTMLAGCGTVATRDGGKPYESDPDLLEFPSETVVLGIHSGPAAWRTAAAPATTKQRVPVEGEACQRGIGWPTGTNPGAGYSTNSGLTYETALISGKWGQGGLADAVKVIEEKYKNIESLTDVKIDMHQRTILIYRESCVRVSALAVLK